MGRVPNKLRWVLFQLPHLTTKECPCHVLSDSMSSKQINGQTTELPVALKSSPDDTKHSESHLVHTTLATFVYTKLPCSKATRFLTSDMHSAGGCASQTLRVHSTSHAKLAPEWVLIQDPIQKIGPKVGVGTLSQEYGTCIPPHIARTHT